MEHNPTSPTRPHRVSLNALKRFNTNESIQDSIFSRQASSTSMVSTGSTDEATPMKGASNSNNYALSLDALCNELSKVASGTQTSSGQPKSANNLTTTPTNEPVIEPSKWCIILVGLPACGKSSISKHLIQYTKEYFQENDLIDDFKIDTFNAGNFRRKMSNFEEQGSDYFNFENKKAKEQREMFAHIALDHLLNSLINSQINVGVFDATNSTKERREYIFDTIRDKERKSGEKINKLILHVKCTDPKLWRYNVEGKTHNPDYINKEHDEAVNDFIHRADLYRAAFQEISKEELEHYENCVYVEVDNGGAKITIDENGFTNHNDMVFIELEEFLNGYKEKYANDYLQKAKEYWTTHSLKELHTI